MSFALLKVWLKGLESQRAEIMEGLRAREAAIDARETKAMEREMALLKMEQQTKAHKDQVEKDALELRQQLHGARAELEDQRRYVEEKRNAAEAIATVIEEREARLKLKEQDLAERKVTEFEKRHHGEELHTHQSSEVGGSAEYDHQAQMLGMRLSGSEESVSLLSILFRSACNLEDPILRLSSDVSQQPIVNKRCLLGDAIRNITLVEQILQVGWRLTAKSLQSFDLIPTCSYLSPRK